MGDCTVGGIPDKNASGDNLYGSRICDQQWVDWVWDEYGFQWLYWYEGWGYKDPCNTDLPLARTLNAIWLLEYSAEDYWNDSWARDTLHWGARYVRCETNDLRAKCGSGTDIRAATFHGLLADDRIELYIPFFYDGGCIDRAGTLLHEARHMGGTPHDAYFPKWSNRPSGIRAADSSWGYEGAWHYHVSYLWAFYLYGKRTTSALRERARQLGNEFLDNCFATDPGFRIAGSSAFPVDGPILIQS